MTGGMFGIHRKKCHPRGKAVLAKRSMGSALRNESFTSPAAMHEFSLQKVCLLETTLRANSFFPLSLVFVREVELVDSRVGGGGRPTI